MKNRHHIQKDFFITYNEIMRNEELTAQEKMVYIAINHLAGNKTGICYARQSTICKYASVSEPTVRKATKRLEELGFISIEKQQLDGMRFQNVYTILDVSKSNEEKEEIKVRNNPTPKNEAVVGPKNKLPINTLQSSNTKKTSNTLHVLDGAGAKQKQKTLLDLPQPKKPEPKKKKLSFREQGLEKIALAKRKQISWDKVTPRDFTFYFIEQHNSMMEKPLTFDMYNSVSIFRDNFIRAYDIPSHEVCLYIDNLIEIYASSPQAWDSLTFNMIQKNVPMMKELMMKVKFAIDEQKPEEISAEIKEELARHKEWKRKLAAGELTKDEIF